MGLYNLYIYKRNEYLDSALDTYIIITYVRIYIYIKYGHVVAVGWYFGSNVVVVMVVVVFIVGALVVIVMH